ncbi:MAG: conserved phage C-terminal domain-containing protein, partial [Staphylococcus simulans]|nr:conserved phage C-terminal domain-containing protein [Staphylococcus simulans]
FIKVIDTKVQQWSGDATMDKYLRPATLFGNKFDDYLNEYQTKKQNNASNSLSETQRKIKELKGEV